MKVAELCLSPDKGGLELYMLRVVRWLAQTGAPYGAIVAPGGKLEALLRQEGLRYHCLKTTFHWFPLTAARRLAQWIDAEGVNVVHVHWAKDLNLAVLARRLAKRPVRIVYTRQMALVRAKHDVYHRALYRHVDLVLVITRRLQQDARRFLPLPPERVQLLYYGVGAAPVPQPDTCAALRAGAGVPGGSFAIGLFGRIEPGKGQHVLIDALGLLRGRDVHALFFGHPMRPGYLDELGAQARRLAVADRVHFCGFHLHPTEIMGCFDCMVLATYNETFGLVLVEAMRAGVAVIGTDAGGVPEIIDNGATGLLVPPRDPAALADAIERLVRDPALRQRLAAAGKASADARFNEERHFAQLAAWLQGRAQP